MIKYRLMSFIVFLEKSECTKGRKSKDIQHNGQKKPEAPRSL
jgi:hypothetical protein